MKPFRQTINSHVRSKALSARIERLSLPGLTLLALLLIAVSIFNPGFGLSQREAVLGIFSPVIAAVNAPIAFLATTVSDISGLATMRAEIQRLETENARLQEWYTRAMTLSAENQALKDLLDLAIDPTLHYTSARVIGGDASPFVNTLIVSAGTNNDIQPGQPVLSDKGLLGRTLEVSENASRVLLMTDINSRIPVRIVDSKQRAIAAGWNGSTLELLYLPNDHDVSVGAHIVTSGDGGLFAADLPVGVVTEIDDNGRVMVTPYADAGRADFVRIVERVEEGGIRMRKATQPLHQTKAFETGE